MRESILITHPKIAKEFDRIKNSLEIEKITYGSRKKVWWKCENCKHSYEATSNNRTNNSSGCPACSGTIITNKNRLSVLYPSLIDEWHPTKNGKNTAANYSYASGKKVWWLCKKCSNTYHAKISKRTLKNKPRGCPACSGRIVSNLNSLSVKFPELSKEWHPTKNGESTTKDYSFGSHKKVWWMCKKEHIWKATVKNRTAGSECPQCNPSSSRLEIRLYSELKLLIPNTTWREKIKGKELDIFLKEQMIGIEIDGSYWHKNKVLKDLEKNKVINEAKVKLIRIREKPLKTLSKYDISVSQTDAHIDIIHNLLKKIIQLINERKLIRKLNQYIHKAQFINEKEYLRISSYLPGPTPENSLLAIYPEVAKDWNYELNYPLKPEMFYPNSMVKVFWKCSKHKEHVWKSLISMRSRHINCPYCTGKKVSKQNSFVINYPDLLEEFDYKKNENIDPNQFTYGSQKKVWWLCKYCNRSWKVAFYTRVSKRIGKPGCRPCKRSKKSRH